MTATPEQLAALIDAAKSVSLSATNVQTTDDAADMAQEAVDSMTLQRDAAIANYENAKAELQLARSALDIAVAAIVG